MAFLNTQNRLQANIQHLGELEDDLVSSDARFLLELLESHAETIPRIIIGEAEHVLRVQCRACIARVRAQTGCRVGLYLSGWSGPIGSGEQMPARVFWLE